MHIDDGESGDFIEANADNDQSVRLQPSLTHLMITKINALNVGKTYRIKLKAYNYAGVAESPILGVILASLPEKPPVPTEVQESSNSAQITISMSDYPESSNGGCEIVSYEV